MTRKEAQLAANEARELLVALLKVTRGLGLSPEHTAAAILDALTSVPKAPYWFAALAHLNADGVWMLQPKNTVVDAPPRLHS
jgi:hypothetical protein